LAPPSKWTLLLILQVDYLNRRLQ